MTLPRNPLPNWFKFAAGRITYHANMMRGLRNARLEVVRLEEQLARTQMLLGTALSKAASMEASCARSRPAPPPDAAALLAWLASHASGGVVGPEHKASFLPAWIDAARELEALGVLAETEAGLEFDAGKWAALLGE
jgi:hypothetical protein